MQKGVTNKRYFALHKPYGYLSQFSGEQDDLLLGELYDFPKDVYSIGRLDKDSEGLLLLTNDNHYKTRLLDPNKRKTKKYFVQVEGDITKKAIDKLRDGSILISHKGKKHKVLAALCNKIKDPQFPERTPPIRYRANIPTSWIEISLIEGKNRQIRKMTAAVGYPTLRLIRVSFESIDLGELAPGDVREYKPQAR